MGLWPPGRRTLQGRHSASLPSAPAHGWTGLLFRGAVQGGSTWRGGRSAPRTFGRPTTVHPFPGKGNRFPAGIKNDAPAVGRPIEVWASLRRPSCFRRRLPSGTPSRPEQPDRAVNRAGGRLSPLAKGRALQRTSTNPIDRSAPDEPRTASLHGSHRVSARQTLRRLRTATCSNSSVRLPSPKEIAAGGPRDSDPRLRTAATLASTWE